MNYYTALAFTFQALPAEADMLSRFTDALNPLDLDVHDENFAVDADILAAMGTREAIRVGMWLDPEKPFTGVDLTTTPDGTVRCVADEPNDLYALAIMIRATCPSALPLGFAYAKWCDTLVDNSFGGGMIVITEDEIICETTGTIIAEKIKNARLLAAKYPSSLSRRGKKQLSRYSHRRTSAFLYL